ncbi:hypothetical protein [Streptomyces olivochromogenes]|nr:hypothetical protein [Streptomyces olivochromogenes]
MTAHLERMDADIADLRSRRAALAAFRAATEARQASTPDALLTW